MSPYADGFSGLELSEVERLGWGLMLYLEVWQTQSVILSLQYMRSKDPCILSTYEISHP